MTDINKGYIPNEQVVIQDEQLVDKENSIEVISKNLVKEFVVSDLDRVDGFSEFMKVDISHAVGVLEGQERYGGISSTDKTWMYEFEEGDRNKGGIAVVRDGQVVDFYPIWESIQ